MRQGAVVRQKCRYRQADMQSETDSNSDLRGPSLLARSCTVVYVHTRTPAHVHTPAYYLVASEHSLNVSPAPPPLQRSRTLQTVCPAPTIVASHREHRWISSIRSTFYTEASPSFALTKPAHACRPGTSLNNFKIFSRPSSFRAVIHKLLAS
jgi:hypothetical protein